MVLKAQYDTQEDIPAGYEDLYTEKNGKWDFTGVAGIKTQADIDRLQKSLKGERDAHKATKEAFQALDGHDLTEVVAKLDQFDELKAAAEAAGGKDVDAIVETRIKSRLAPLERENASLKGQVTELGGKVETFTQKERTRSVHDTVRSAATKLKILPSAIEDALLLADRALTVSDEGTIVVKEGVGFTDNVDVETWLTEVRESRTHWWPASEGGGAGGGSAKGGTPNPFTKAGWNMTEQGRVYKENPARAENMAKSAGTTIGGPRPEK